MTNQVIARGLLVALCGLQGMATLIIDLNRLRPSQSTRTRPLCICIQIIGRFGRLHSRAAGRGSPSQWAPGRG
jgi:hypothetical protein